MTDFSTWLKEKGACREGYVAHHHQTEQEFWDSCQRGDWMLWVAERKYGEQGWPDHIAFVRIAAACARSALPYAGPMMDVSRRAIEAAEAFAGAPSDETRDAAQDAASAALAAAWEAARAAAWAAGRFPLLAAAFAAADAALAAVKDAASAARAAAWAAGDAARVVANKEHADTIRRIWPKVGHGGEA